MKASLFALTLFLFVASTAFPGNKTEPAATPTPASALWPQDSTVTVYFVRGLFTVEQREILRRTLETWTAVDPNSSVKFLYAGETGGLIDCLRCLTLTRQELHTRDHKRHASFNRLRSDQTGQLASAWIGFDNSITDSQKLRSLLVQALGTGRLSAPPPARPRK